MFGTASIPNRPTAKLSVAAGLVCVAMIRGLFANLDHSWFHGLLSGMGLIWVVFGIFCISGFQIMFGLMGLILGILAVGLPIVVVVSNLITETESSRFVWSFGWNHLLNSVGAITVSYILLFDKEVAEYRRQLALRFPSKHRLDPTVDNLPDDPINPA